MCKDSNDTVAREPYLSTLRSTPAAGQKQKWREARGLGGRAPDPGAHRAGAARGRADSAGAGRRRGALRPRGAAGEH